MISRWWTGGVVLLLVVVASGSALAMSSLTGPTGVVGTPTAMVATSGTIEAALSYQRLAEKQLESSFVIYDPYQPPIEQVTEVNDDTTAWGGELLGGIGGKGEYWVQYLGLDDGHSSHIWGAGGKLMLMQEPKNAVNLAVGLGYWNWVEGFKMYSTGEMFDIGYWNAYLVATKDLRKLYGKSYSSTTRTLGSLGLMYVRVDPDRGSRHSLTRPFVSVQVVGNRGTSVGLEYRWKDSEIDRKAVFSAVVRHEFPHDWSAEAGVTNSDPFGIGLDDSNIFTRVAYRFGYGGYGKGGY